MGQVITLSQFMLFSFIRHTPALGMSFGFTLPLPALISFILFQLISAPLDEVRRGASFTWLRRDVNAAFMLVWCL
jgi:hypothetical protein